MRSSSCSRVQFSYRLIVLVVYRLKKRWNIKKWKSGRGRTSWQHQHPTVKSHTLFSLSSFPQADPLENDRLWSQRTSILAMAWNEWCNPIEWHWIQGLSIWRSRTWCSGNKGYQGKDDAYSSNTHVVTQWIWQLQIGRWRAVFYSKTPTAVCGDIQAAWCIDRRWCARQNDRLEPPYLVPDVWESTWWFILETLFW